MMSLVGRECVCDLLQCNGLSLHTGESTAMELEVGKIQDEE